MHLTIGSFVDLVKYTNSDELKEKYPPVTYIIPKRLTQDIVESWLSYQIGCCGDGHLFKYLMKWKSRKV